MSKTLNSKLAAGTVVLMMLLSGCGGGTDPEGFVQLPGEVTWNGEPIQDGMIIFRGSDSSERNVAAPITDGKFIVKIQPGKKTVEVTAMREVPGKFGVGPSGEQVPLTEAYIPAKYNTASELTTEIVVPGTETLQFALQEN
ncbi:hypothetical protein EC9_41830 [Rosistilla ulvae]|uniref:Carboxypeptidase regulatory-like domain-containing protein n=1 Tax=Rosistilla ulvae TaxID=1930277 RepID=A0A517M528_9BACT|nr:hypothetical protein EC9_41830 [Rosistilla ulvae]